MPLSEQQLLERDRRRDLKAELLQSVDEMLAGCTAAQHDIDLPDVVQDSQKAGIVLYDLRESKSSI